MHSAWKTISIISGILCAVFFLVFWNLTDPFWRGIIRLGSFIFFAITVLGCLKLMNGPLVVRLSSTKDLLLVSYQKKEKVIHKEEFERESIQNVTATEPSSSLLRYVQPKSIAYKINFSDTDRDLYLFEFSGRPLLFSAASQKKIKDFLQGLEIDV